MKDISIERRQNMVRSLREAGLSFEEIAAILRTGSHCNEQTGPGKHSAVDMPDTEWLHQTPAL